MSIGDNSNPIKPATDYDLVKDIFNKAVESCVICYLTRKMSYRAGLAYGGLAGLIQLLFSGIHEKIDEKTTTPKAKTLNYLFSSYLPWVISGFALRQVYKNTGNEHMLISFEMGQIIALIQQVIGKSNIHLLPKD